MGDGVVGDLVELVRAKASGLKEPSARYVGLEHIAVDGGLIGTAPASVSNSVNGRFEAGDLLFGKLRPNLRKAVQVDFAGYSSTDLLILRSRDGVDSSYAKHLVASEGVFRHAEANSVGTRMPRTSWSAISEAPVWVAPSAEQPGIAEMLDALDEAIRSTERVIAKARVTRGALLADVVSSETDQRAVSQFASVTVGHVGPTAEHYVTAGEGPIFLRTGNVGRGQLLLEDVRFVSEEFHGRSAKSALHGGEVVVSRVGYTGNAAVVPANLGPANCANMIIVRPSSVISPEYLCLMFESDAVLRQVSGLTAGSAQPVLNVRLVGRLRIPWLALADQRMAVRTIAAAEMVEVNEVARGHQLRSLRAGLADDLLSGRVRTVPA